MGWLYQLFFPAHTPTENELEMGRYRIIAEGAVAGVIYAVATARSASIMFMPRWRSGRRDLCRCHRQLSGRVFEQPWGVRILMRRSGHDTVFRVRTAVFLALCV